MSAEEKDVEASEKKLRMAREKGQVAQSRDLTTALALIVAMVYLISRLGDFLNELATVWKLPVDYHDAGIEEAIRRASTGFASSAMHFLAALFVAVIIGAFFGEMIMKKGLTFSFEALMPKMERIDPIAGFGKMFAIAKLIDLIKALIKLAVLGIGGAMTLSRFLNQLMWVPRCGVSCIGSAWGELVTTLAGLTILVFAVNGLIDMRLQIWLFLRGQRMTKTEAKREWKDQNPNPELKRAVRQNSRPTKGGGGGKSAVQHAVLILGNSAVAIGIRFVVDETPAPVCVCKGRGPAAKRIISEAENHGIPIHADAVFADELFKQTRVMSVLPPPSYRVIAQIFKQHKII